MNLNGYSKKHGTDYSKLWDTLDSQILRVLDEEGNNVADCQIRHLIGRHWLCVDDVDGYAILTDDEVSGLILAE